MIYEPAKVVLLGLLKCPSGPPPSPAGSPGSVQIFRASKNYLLYRIVVAEVFFAVAFLASSILSLVVVLHPSDFALDLWFPVFLLPFLLLFLGFLAYFIIRLEYDMRYYIVTDRSLRIRQGVLNITEVTLTYANVQQLEIRQGPVQQLLGIADLMVRTAGGAVIVAPQQGGVQIRGHRGVLTGIDNAPEIRDQINHLLRRYRDAGLGDPEDRRRQPPPPKAAPAARWSPATVQRLLEIRDELRAWRQEQGASSG